jgi:predicted nucleotide-binding protein
MSRLEYRARQNVVFESGYLVGRLGRERVCCIYRKGTILPSDINGLLYKEVSTSIEEIGWSLVRELKAAGYDPKI